MKDNREIISHLAYWMFIGAILGLTIFMSGKSIFSREVVVSLGYYSIINISVFYINYTLLIPQLLKKYWMYILALVLLIAGNYKKPGYKHGTDHIYRKIRFPEHSCFTIMVF